MVELLKRWLPVLGLLAVGALAIWLLRAPRPLPASTPATEFAAGRTLADLDSVAREPHAIGTAANARVRGYLLRRLQALGLPARVQDTTVMLRGRSGLVLAHVQNVLARLPGTQPGGRAVLVLAHYDSQPHAPGAGDDGAGVVALLETIRALRAGPPLAHDVEWLFTDGEEAGLLGARAYAADTALLRQRIGLVLNVEGRGNAGPSLLFEMSEGNGGLVREVARVAPHPVASSLFYEAYHRLPNDTDFTPLREAGLPGLNFAFVGGFPYYHSPADTPGRLVLASVQHHGSYLLALVRHFAGQPLPMAREADYTFFNLLGPWLVHYPTNYDYWVLGLAALVVALAAGLAQPQRRLGLGGLALGLLAWVGCTGLALALAAGLLAAVRALYPAYLVFYGGTFYNSLAYQVALLGGTVAGLGAGYALLARRLLPDALVGGALLAQLLLAAGLAWVAPSGAYLLAWPVLAAGLAWNWRLLRPVRPGRGATLADWLPALPAVLLLGPIGYLLLDVFGLGTLVLAAPLLLAAGWALVLPVLLPVLCRPVPGRAGAQRQTRPSWGVAGLGLLGVMLGLGWGHLTRQPTPAQPQQTQLAYVLQANARRAHWTSTLPALDAWARQALGSYPYRGPLPGSTSGRWWHAAPVLPLVAPRAQVLADTTWAGRRHLRLQVRAGAPAATSLRLAIGKKLVRWLRVSGQVLPLATAATAIELDLVAPSPGGTLLEAELAPGGRLCLEVTERRLGLPAEAGLPPLPAGFVPAPGFASFTTQVKKQIAF